MQAYLRDTVESISKYANGYSNSDKPMPIRFNLGWDDSDVVPTGYELSLSESSDMSNPTVISSDDEYCDVYNLKTGTKYYWTSTLKCADSTKQTSDVAEFSVQDAAPRNLYVDGVKNFRDLGGWRTDSGKINQGLLYRSFCWDDKNGTKITASGIDTIKNTLKIKTEIDLRSQSERGSVTGKSIVDGVEYYIKSMNYNDDMLDASNRTKIKEIFDILGNESNYPIVYHCQAGADRTGVVSYIINGLCGVEKDDLLRDYLITNFSNMFGFRGIETISEKYVKTLDNYTGNTLKDKIYNYLNIEVGVPTQTLDSVRSILCNQ